MMAVNINCKRYDFISWMFMGLKSVETRRSHSLRCYVGKRVGLCQTGKGKATLVGYATIAEEIEYRNTDEFAADILRHCICKESTYFKHGKSYGYRLENILMIKPIELNSKGIISRWCPDEL